MRLGIIIAVLAFLVGTTPTARADLATPDLFAIPEESLSLLVTNIRAVPVQVVVRFFRSDGSELEEGSLGDLVTIPPRATNSITLRTPDGAAFGGHFQVHTPAFRKTAKAIRLTYGVGDFNITRLYVVIGRP